MTLIELLIVIGIIMAVAAVAIPSLKPAMESRRTREAARQVSVYFGSARARAMETGRPCGVMIERSSSEPRVGMTLHQVEVPPPYSGETVGAVAGVTITDGNPVSYAEVTVYFVQRADPTKWDPINPSVVRPGDQIQLNGQGPFYAITSVDASGNTLTAQVNLSTGISLPWADKNPSLPWPDNLPLTLVPYKILRQPQKGSAQPMQLPAATVIDFEASGTELPNFLFGNDTSPVKILFSGSGALEGVYASCFPSGMAPGIMPVYLLVGKRERVPQSITEDGFYNFQDFDNFWIGITPQGLVTTEQVGTWPTNTTGRPGDVHESRYFVRSGRAMGGG